MLLRWDAPTLYRAEHSRFGRRAECAYGGHDGVGIMAFEDNNPILVCRDARCRCCGRCRGDRKQIGPTLRKTNFRMLVDRRVVVNHVEVSGPGDRTRCTALYHQGKGDVAPCATTGGGHDIAIG